MIQTIPQRRNYELWLILIAILVISLVYLGAMAVLEGVPPASELFGHGLGILGFVLMLMTEILYSIRKRSRRAQWGRMSAWLNFHIFTGVVGPYMVLLHTSWKYNGLAGLTLLLTILIVLSGFIGRYIYTAIPRSAEGVELGNSWLRDSIAAIQSELIRWSENNPQSAADLFRRLKLGDITGMDSTQLLAKDYRPGWLQKLRWRRARRSLDPISARSVIQLEELLDDRYELQKQVASLARMRQFFAIWHTVHIPLGLVLFTAAFIHIGAAIYYATLLR